MTAETVKRMSPQQRAVVEWVRDGRGSAFVEAVAGAGKTTTLIAAVRETTGFVNFCAYNKKIADEIKGKIAKLNLGNRVRVGTFHSFGLGAWRRVYPEVKIDERGKSDKIALELGLAVPLGHPHPLDSGLRPFVEKLISLAKQRAIGLYGAIDDQSLWYDIVEHFDLAYEIEDEASIRRGIELAIQGLRRHIELAKEIVDFDDMIYMPVTSGIRVWENDWVLTDECQDTNPARRALVRKMLKPNGRALFVGDTRQAIYAYQGADSDAVDQIVRDFKCVLMPLTVTFRCPKAVVQVAREIVNHIEAHDTAPEGIVRTINVAEMEAKDMLASYHPTDDAILCRKTKPLVEMAYKLIRSGVACHVEGRDIGAGLLKLVNRFSARTLAVLEDKLKAYAEREVAKLMAKGKETQAEALQDRVDTVRVIADTCKDVGELRQKIADLFQDANNEAKPTLTLSTVHKSKGREWKRVFILGRDEYMPSPYARQQWQALQEANLIYVSYTRAQSELVLVNTAGGSDGAPQVG